MTSNLLSTERQAQRITLVGGVQGFGIRPAIARLAYELHLRGTVRNAMQGVIIELEGSSQSLAAFGRRVMGFLPTQAQVIERIIEPIELVGFECFQIIQSDASGNPSTEVPVDLKICDRCVAELRDPNNRRFEYAFTNCTDCGPRYSILHAMPYDRERTSMNRFTMCDVCNQEYSSPTDRRFHSQTNCCRECGPTIWFSTDEETVVGEEAIARAASLVRQGKILAMKGLGGYQLLCDATNNHSVESLRERKHRATKPLAVMVDTPEQADLIAVLSSCERQALGSSAGPIVLLEARSSNGLAKSIHPGLNTVGVMLPTTAIHSILLDRCKVPLVVTSGNLEGEPIEYRVDAAKRNLSTIADGFLHHDRKIMFPTDDSVVRCMNDRVVTIRAARGLTPFAVELQSDSPQIAVGGQQKSSIAIATGKRGILGPHLGDLESIACRERFEQQLKDIQRLYSVQPSSVAHDMHPDYASTRCAQASGKPCHAVQHHHAHVVAGMLENGWLEQTVLGFAFDGTGLGENGSLQGGEILLATAKSYFRIGSLRAFPLLGGEAAIRDPNRVALALLKDSIEPNLDEAIDSFGLQTPDTARDLAMLEDRRWSPLTTSVGRLFDGVASLVLERTRPSYEGELAMQLESLCDHRELGSYPFDIVETFDGTTSRVEIDWRPMIRALNEDRKQVVRSGIIAMRFHRGLANAIAEIVNRLRPSSFIPNTWFPGSAWEPYELQAPPAATLSTPMDTAGGGASTAVRSQAEPNAAHDFSQLISKNSIVAAFVRTWTEPPRVHILTNVATNYRSQRWTEPGNELARAGDEGEVSRFPNYPVILSGGVFQNRVLVELLDPLLSTSGRIVGWPGCIPPNDGGLSIGQLAIAVARQQQVSASCKKALTKEAICV